MKADILEEKRSEIKDIGSHILNLVNMIFEDQITQRYTSHDAVDERIIHLKVDDHLHMLDFGAMPTLLEKSMLSGT